MHMMTTTIMMMITMLCLLFMSAEESFDKYLKRMRQNKTWGDGNLLAAASILYRRPLRIFFVYSDQPIVIDSGPLQKQGTAIALTLGFVSSVPGNEPNLYVSLLPDLVGQVYDGAAAMSGQHNVVQKHILDQGPTAIYVHCASHALNLCLAKASNVPEIRAAVTTMHEVAVFYNESNKRLLNLQQFIDSECPDSSPLLSAQR